MFGINKKRVNLIKEMITQRMINRGHSASEIQCINNNLGTFTSLSLPEGTIVVIIQTVIGAHKQGVPLCYALEKFEKGRRFAKHDEFKFQEIIKLSTGENPELALVEYCYYRISIEATKSSIPLTKDEVLDALDIAYPEISSW